MSDELRSRGLVLGRWVRANGIFRYDTRLQMINVHLFFLAELFRTFRPNRQLDSKWYDNYAVCTIAAP